MWEAVERDVTVRLVRAYEEAVAGGDLPAAPLPEFAMEVPREESHGDLATNLALLLARPLKRSPRAIAEALLRHFRSEGSYVERTEVAGAGFLNFFLSQDWWAPALEEIARAGSAWGGSGSGGERSILLEYVSANPTGPLNVVSARAAAVGDTLARLLAFSGYRVHREFYVNDAGSQVQKLALSLEARIRQALGQAAEVPEGGYVGDYLQVLARTFLEVEGPAVLAAPEEERIALLGRYATDAILDSQQRDLSAYGVEFDRFYRERDLHASGRPRAILAELQERGATREEDGALWLRSEGEMDDKDRVLVKSDGNLTYLVPDLAYHAEKFQRGFDQAIDLLGPDHHGYVGRLRSGLSALGVDPERLEVIIVQVVRLLREGEAVRMSKRQGEFVTLAELVEEVGKDAARFFFLLRSPDSPLDFDLSLAIREGNENPVYYVQYAHARIHSILRQIPPQEAEADLRLLTAPEEGALIAKLAAFPAEVARAASAREPQRIARYALDLAALFHGFYNRHRVLGVEPPLSQARLLLIGAVGSVLRTALELMGVSAPERM